MYDKIIAAIRASGYTGSLREWCNDAGVSEGYLSNLRDRCKKNPDATIRADAAEAISAKLGMTVDQLLGVRRAADPSERYSHLPAAVRAARELGYSAEAIAAGSSASPEGDPPRLWWFHRIEAEEDRLRSSRPSSILRSFK